MKFSRFMLISENGNVLEQGETQQDRRHMLYVAAHCFRNTMVGLHDTLLQREEYFDIEGRYRCIDWSYLNKTK
jgi:hypothetical protein